MISVNPNLFRVQNLGDIIFLDKSYDMNVF